MRSELTLRPGEKRQLGEQGTENLEAYQLYLQGLASIPQDELKMA